MLREVKSARFVARRTLLGRRFAFPLRDGTEAVWRAGPFTRLSAAADREPQPLIVDGERVWWLFERRLLWTDDETLDAHDVLALVRARDRRERRSLERAHDLLAADREPHRTAPTRSRDGRRALTRDVRRAVWERDGGACVTCGARFDLQYDHVIPLALGGADSVENLQVLCGPCNQSKGAAIG